MLPFPGVLPYPQAPAWCFPIAELSMLLLFSFCLAHAIKKGKRDVLYLIGGMLFGVLLEYMEVLMHSYTYGRFWVMVGKAPMDVPLCIGAGWGIIMYTARLFSDSIRMSLLACAALDTLLALNVDLSMDTVAYRTHMWHWNWVGTGLDPLRAQWFGVPWGNFIGWQTVVFCYSGFSRLFEKAITKRASSIFKFILTTLLALLCSLAVLYVTEVYIFPVMQNNGILSVHRFVGISVILLVIVLWGWRNKSVADERLPGIAWWVPGWFHAYFFGCFFILGFYTENKWMTIAACLNILAGIVIHVWPVRFGKRTTK